MIIYRKNYTLKDDRKSVFPIELCRRPSKPRDMSEPSTKKRKVSQESAAQCSRHSALEKADREELELDNDISPEKSGDKRPRPIRMRYGNFFPKSTVRGIFFSLLEEAYTVVGEESWYYSRIEELMKCIKSNKDIYKLKLTVLCDHLTDNHMSMIPELFPSLKSLDLFRCKKVTDAGVEALVKGLPGLESLDLTFGPLITDKAVIAIARYCPKIFTLSLDYCFSVTNKGLFAIAVGCQQLSSINLLNCDLVTDDGLEALAKGCKKLSYIRGTGHGHSAKGIAAMVIWCPNLKYMNLQYVTVTDALLKTLAAWCPQLTYLKIGELRIHDITDLGIIALAKGCPELSSLNICFCNITDAAVKALLKYCKNLSKLDIDFDFCEQISDETYYAYKADPSIAKILYSFDCGEDMDKK